MANSTLTRELHRNSSKREVYNGKYLKDKLKNVASVLRAIGLSGKLYASLSNIILLKNWTNIWISCWKSIKISHETYAWNREGKRNYGNLYTYLRHRLKHRNRYVGAGKSHIHDRRSIHDRPIEDDGKRFGDLEMDTIVGSNNQQAIVTSWWSTNMLFMKKLKYGKDARKLAQYWCLW